MSNTDSLEYFNPHKSLLNGSEKFTFQDSELDYTVKDYWAWSFSDLYNNIYRGILAEYVVATALGITPPHGDFLRVVWNPFDLLSKSGKRVEVKSAAYLQSWETHFSKISFGIAPASVHNGISRQRNCDVYVFCLYTAESRDVSPLNLDFWEFYVLSARVLNEKKPKQKSITLSSLKKLNPVCVKYDHLADAIEAS